MDGEATPALRVRPASIVLGVPVIGAGIAAALVVLVELARDGRIAWPSATFAAIAGLMIAGVIGLPVTQWGVSHERTRLGQWIALGALGGDIVLLVPLVGHVVRSLLLGDLDSFPATWRALVRVTLHAIGLGDFFSFGKSLLWVEAAPILGGALAGAVFWWACVRRPPG